MGIENQYDDFRESLDDLQSSISKFYCSIAFTFGMLGTFLPGAAMLVDYQSRVFKREINEINLSIERSIESSDKSIMELRRINGEIDKSEGLLDNISSSLDDIDDTYDKMKSYRKRD